MTWLAWLMVAALVAAFAALTGVKPKGTRHVAHTSLIGVARVALLLIVAILIYAAVRTHTGG